MLGSYVKLHNLMDDYFGCKAPFSKDKKDKKAEFPDAVILNSLEIWAEKNDAKVLAVSLDGDWESYCVESERIVVEKEITIALEKMQQDLEKTEATLNEFLSSILKNTNEDFNREDL